MAVRRISELPNLADVSYINEVIKNVLIEIGNEAIKFAIQNHEFNNRTKNLEDSYGFAIYKNGNIIYGPFVTNKQAIKGKKYNGKDYIGHDEAINFLNNYEPEGKDWALVVTAGMFYASWVEKYYLLDVLQNSKIKAESVATEIFSKIKWVSI